MKLPELICPEVEILKMALVRPGHCRELSVGTKIAGIGPETAEELRDKECDQKTIPFLYYR